MARARRRRNVSREADAASGKDSLFEGASTPDDRATPPELRGRPHIEVFDRYSILIREGNVPETVWLEGPQDAGTVTRYKAVVRALEAGFLDQRLVEAVSPERLAAAASRLSEGHRGQLRKVVESVNAQSGRALVDIFVGQLAIKSIARGQDIRLHKGSTAKGSFSWKAGMSMRNIDSQFIVPFLRKNDLLRMNEYGAFMTRSFAENYPYTTFYKADIAGAARVWLLLVKDVQSGALDAPAALVFVLSLLWQASAQFTNEADLTLREIKKWIAAGKTFKDRVVALLMAHIEASDARPRLLEVAMHSLLQALEDTRVPIGGKLKQLMPLRTANRKHGNIGDIEVLHGVRIVEAWDAKYGIQHLGDPINELEAKVAERDGTDLRFGFVLLPRRKRFAEVERRKAEILAAYRLQVEEYTLPEWAGVQFERAAEADRAENKVAAAWLVAYVESLTLRRRERAPIDEPTLGWLTSLRGVLRKRAAR